MKVIHLNTYTTGGAARAACRIHLALRLAGVESEMLVACKSTDEENITLSPTKFKEMKLRLVHKLLSFQGSSNPTYHTLNLFSSGVGEIVNSSDADIVHLHWIGDEFISISEISKIKKPIVWTLHDMWTFCGAEHYDNLEYPGRYKGLYSRINRPKSHNGLIDIDAWTWRRKQIHWRNTQFHFVTPSRWLGKCLHDSFLFSGVKAEIIPYCLNTEIFKPLDINKSRELFNLPQDTNIVLFGAKHGKRNSLKGYKYLEKALYELALDNDNKKITCVTFGGGISNSSSIKDIPIIEVGNIEDDKKLAVLYNAADVFVAPSVMDNLPNTLIEAMSCGTPCVGFDVGGVPDIIDHRKNGIVVTPFNTKELADAIKWILSRAVPPTEMRKQAREKALSKYHPLTVAEKYKEFYRNVLKMN